MSDYPFAADPRTKQELIEIAEELEEYLGGYDGCDLASAGMRSFVAHEVIDYLYEEGRLVLP